MDEILNLLINKHSVLLVGEGRSGKTYFVEHELIPALESGGVKALFLNDLESDVPSEDFDVLIADEFETFIDKDYLEKNHPDENPYYSDKYIEQVKGWHLRIKEVKKPILFLLTRDARDINNVLASVDHTDWGLPVQPIKFTRK